jgi:hypothetical protein
MKNHMDQLQDIYDSWINGNGRQMVDQVKDYGLYNVWHDLRSDLEVEDKQILLMVLLYFRIDNR